GANSDNGWLIGIKRSLIAMQVPICKSLTQTWNTIGNRITMRIWTLGRLYDFFDNMFWRGAIRVAHEHINNIFATPARRHLQLPGNIENIWGKSFYTWKMPHGQHHLNRSK